MSLDVYLMLPNEEVFSYNITHNLNRMADAVGFYKHLWRPEELGITTAKELIEPLTEGLHKLKSQPEWFSTFNPSNRWGSYDGLVRFVEEYLEACKKYPDSTIEVSR